ncbi:hypothetical protein Efla_000040 [Eimeria flavescens]
MEQEDRSQLRRAPKLNANEDLFGGSDGEDEDVAAVDEPKGVQLFDFDAYGRKIGKPKYEATFGSSSESSSTERSSSSGSSSSSSSSSGESSGTFEFDDEDFAELSGLRRDRRGKKEDPMSRRRMWESSFFINSFMNLETKEQYFFYSITFGHVNKKRVVRGSLRRRFLYTPGYKLKPGEYRPLAAPLVIWPLKVFLLPYNQLHNFCVTVEQWRISDFSFNSLYASARLTLKEIMEMEPEFQLLLKRKLPGGKRSYEVHKMRVSFQLNEVFDIDMVFDSWWFLPDNKMPLKLQQHPKALSLNVPIQGRSTKRSTAKTDISKNNFWSYAGFFSFRGTLPSLSNQYIVVQVACMFEGKWYRPPLQLGVCIMSLKSVTTYPLFRGVVKKLTTNPKKFQQGEIIGNIRCFIRSVGVLGYEDVPFRPTQSVAGTALVTQLNLKEQYLVVRVFKCENLAVANADSFSSNPMVKVKWDGMVNAGAKRENTLRPVFNQSFYFPVRLLDPRERTDTLFRKFTLPLDLYAKGLLSFEVWDSDDTTSDFLGGATISLHLLWKEGQRDTRSLAVGMEESDEKTRLPDGRPAEFANRDASDYSQFGDTLLGEGERIVVPPYEWPYETLVLKRVLELKGFTLPQPSGERSLLWCEVFFIPPMPEDVEMPPQPVIKNSNDIWMQVERRWNKDFRRWQKMYLQWFPEAPKERGFLSVAEHSQSRLTFPLPSFVVPIAVPAQLAVEGELLHWLSNIAYLFSPKQLREGEFQRWQSPASFLTTRRGAVNDHAVLLCSCLLGLDYDAYVCKGTVDGYGTDHAWVMTRHAGGWIMFWEVTTRKRYCLPFRQANNNMWGYPSKGPPEIYKPKESLEQAAEKYWEGTYLEEWFAWIESQAAAATVAARMAAEGATIPDSEIWGEDVAPDETLDPEAVVMEEGGILTESNGPRKTKSVGPKVDKSELRSIMQKQLDKLPITPFKDLLRPDSTLSYVPYSSIEVVFNNFQLWGNLQNLHPACITYDFDDLWKWRPLLTEPADPIETDIIIATPIRDKKCHLLADDLVGNVIEHIRMQRLKNGNDVSFEHREEMLSKLTFYLDLLEFRLHLDEAHNPGPPEGHEGWSSFPEEMADASATAKADYDFFDAVQASNVPNAGEGPEPDIAVRNALQMMGEGTSELQDMFRADPPPGGVFDPFMMTDKGIYVASQEAHRLGGQQGGYLHLETPAAPSRPALYQVPLNPVDAAAAAFVNYEDQQRMAQKEEANLVKSYMAGGGHQGWMTTGNQLANNVAPSGLQFNAMPQHAAQVPSRDCSTSSLKAKLNWTKLQQKKPDPQPAAFGSVKQRWKNGVRSKLRSVHRMLEQVASEGCRLLQSIKKDQRAGKAAAESRSFHSGTTAAAAAAGALGKDCGNPSAMPKGATSSPLEKQTESPQGRPIEGGVILGEGTGPDTSTLLLQKLTKDSQLIAKELDEHIRSIGRSALPSFRGLLASRQKQQALRPWRRATAFAAAVKKQEQKDQRRKDNSRVMSLSTNGFNHKYNSGSPCLAEAPTSDGVELRRRAQLVLKEELRRRVYEQMEARAAERQAQSTSWRAQNTGGATEGGEGEGQLLRVFKEGFDTDPPSSHRSYETASEFESSESAPTEAYVSPSSDSSSSSRNSSRVSNSSRLSGCSRASTSDLRKELSSPNYETLRKMATVRAAANTAAEAASFESDMGRQTSAEQRRKSKRRADFKWVAAYADQMQGGRATAVGQRRQRHIALSLEHESEPLGEQMKNSGSQGTLGQMNAPSSHVETSSRRTPPQRSRKGSTATIDLEADRAESFVSEKGTLDSLPDSDCCEPSAMCSPQQFPVLISPCRSSFRRRFRRGSTRSDRIASNCESIAELLKSALSEEELSTVRDSREPPTDAAERNEALPAPAGARQPRDSTNATVDGRDYQSVMAKHGARGAVSERMLQLYEACVQRARSSYLPKVVPLFNESRSRQQGTSAGRGVTAGSGGKSAGFNARVPVGHSTACVRSNSRVSELQMRSESADSCIPAWMFPVEVDNHKEGHSPISCLVGAHSSKFAPLISSESGAVIGSEEGQGPKFTKSKLHGMMMDIDYDQVNRKMAANDSAPSGPPPAPPGMVYNPLTGVNEYDYAVTTTGGTPYGNMALGATQQAGQLAPVALNQGRLAGVRREGAYRVDATTGEKNYVDGGGMDRARQYGATDFINAKTARPNVKADGLPRGFDMSYARQQYEMGVATGAETLVRGGERQLEAMQLEREVEMHGIDPYGELLQPPKEPSKEYASYDGGVDLARMGFAPEGAARKAIRRRDGAQQHDKEGLAGTSPESLEASSLRTINSEPCVPTEWKMPVSSGTYAAEQVAKWNWYYRMEQVYFLWQQNAFPVKPNHVFCGFPIHLATSDSTEIRSYLGGGRRFRRLLDLPVENITYVVTAKCYPLMGGVISTWLFFGAQVPLGSSQDRKSHMRRIKRPPHTKQRRRLIVEVPEGSQNAANAAGQGEPPAGAPEQPAG